MAKKKKKINVVVCPVCGEDASGSDLASVNEAMARHQAKKHPRKGKP
jgi:formylmethanofuran dehydrogenase subunit E